MFIGMHLSEHDWVVKYMCLTNKMLYVCANIKTIYSIVFEHS